MKTVGFVGPSGTGKSYRAQWVAQQKGIHYIIDDGLLVSDNRIVAGVSAKKEPTKLASVRCALFTEPSHAQDVKKAIQSCQPDSIMILGTSLKMAESIAKTLGLPSLAEVIKIEDIATEDEILLAKEIRRKEGKHVIPVPTFEIKKDFSGYFIDSVKSFFLGKKNEENLVERSVVRPTFSYLGDYTIADRVVGTICLEEANKIDGVTKVYKVITESKGIGTMLYIDIGVRYGCNIKEVGEKVRVKVRKAVELYTGINVLGTTVFVKNFVSSDTRK